MAGALRLRRWSGIARMRRSFLRRNQLRRKTGAILLQPPRATAFVNVGRRIF
jgi:hypothetical protein